MNRTSELQPQLYEFGFLKREKQHDFVSCFFLKKKNDGEKKKRRSFTEGMNVCSHHQKTKMPSSQKDVGPGDSCGSPQDWAGWGDGFFLGLFFSPRGFFYYKNKVENFIIK